MKSGRCWIKEKKKNAEKITNEEAYSYSFFPAVTNTKTLRTSSYPKVMPVYETELLRGCLHTIYDNKNT